MADEQRKRELLEIFGQVIRSSQYGPIPPSGWSWNNLEQAKGRCLRLSRRANSVTSCGTLSPHPCWGPTFARRVSLTLGYPGHAVEYTPDGRYFIAPEGLALEHKQVDPQRSHFEVRLNVFDSETMEKVFRLAYPVDAWTLDPDTDIDGVRCLAFSLDGEILAAGAQTGSIHFWRWQERKYLGRIQAHEDRVNQLTFARGDELLVTCSRNGELKAWSLPPITRIEEFVASHEKTFRTFEGVAAVGGFSCSEQAHTLATAGYYANIFGLESLAKLASNPGFFKACVLPDGSFLAANQRDLFRIPDPRESDASPPRTSRFQADHRANIVGVESDDKARFFVTWDESVLRFWDRTTGSPIQEFPLPAQCTDVAFHPEKNQMIAVYWDTVTQFEIRNDNVQTIHSFGGEELLTGTMSRDARTIATARKLLNQNEIWTHSGPDLGIPERFKLGLYDEQVRLTLSDDSRFVAATLAMRGRALLIDRARTETRSFTADWTSVSAFCDGKLFIAAKVETSRTKPEEESAGAVLRLPFEDPQSESLELLWANEQAAIEVRRSRSKT